MCVIWSNCVLWTKTHDDLSLTFLSMKVDDLWPAEYLTMSEYDGLTRKEVCEMVYHEYVKIKSNNTYQEKRFVTELVSHMFGAVRQENQVQMIMWW